MQNDVTVPTCGRSTCSVVGTPSLAQQPRGGMYTLLHFGQRSPMIFFCARPVRNLVVAAPAVYWKRNSAGVRTLLMSSTSCNDFGSVSPELSDVLGISDLRPGRSTRCR